MERTDILKVIEEVVSDVIDNRVCLTESSCAEDVEGWDSLAHIQIIDGLQGKFNVKFSAKDMISWLTVGNMIDSIERKIS